MIRGHYDEIILNIDSEPVTLREAARMSETLAGSDGFYIDRSILPADTLDRPTTLLIQLAPGADISAVEQSLAAAGATRVQTGSSQLRV